MQKLSGICSSLEVYSTFVVIAIALCSCMTVVTMIVKSGTHLQEFRVQVASFNFILPQKALYFLGTF